VLTLKVLGKYIDLLAVIVSLCVRIGIKRLLRVFLYTGF